MGKTTKMVRVYEEDTEQLEQLRRVYTKRDGEAKSLADVIHELVKEHEALDQRKEGGDE